MPDFPALIDLSALGSAGFKIQGDANNDGAGGSVSSAGDVNGDGFDDFLIGAPRNGSGGYNAGAAYLLFGKAGGFTSIDLASLAAASGFKIKGTGSSNAGGSVSSAGDVNGDGFDDIVIGAQAAGGAAYVIFGKASGFTEIDLGNLSAADGFRIQGDPAQQYAGNRVSSAGDVNGDGFDDILVGARGNYSTGSGEGAAYVIFGKASGFTTIQLATLDPGAGFRIEGDDSGASSNDYAGASISSAGDINGDGFDDLLVGAPGNDSGGNGAGAAYVIFGKASGFTAIDLSTLAIADGFKIQGDAASDSAGWSVSSAGDLNGDGYGDMLIGARGNDSGATNAGAVYVIFGKADGFGLIDLAGITASDGFKIQGDAADDLAGDSVSSAGDVNGDGFDDLLVGSFFNDSGGYSAGAAYVIFGKASGFTAIDLSALAIADGFKIQGDNATDFAGGSVSAAGDVNGDGFDDMIVGAFGNDGGGTNAGAAYVIFGVAPTTGVTRVGSAAGQTIRGGIGDDTLDGAEGDDSLFGAGGNDMLIGGTGADAMTGGVGDDVYVIGDTGDTITELAGEGIDEVRTSLATFSLQSLAYVENLSATSDSAHDFRGNGADNVLTGAGGADFFRLQGGGVDIAVGGGGNDFFYFGAALTGADQANGGIGTDQFALQGNYALTFGAGIVGIESLVLLPGSDMRFGDTANNFYDYVLATDDANVAAGQRLTIDANRLRAGEDFTFDGSAETDGNFFTVGGHGVDLLIGGAQSDTFLFGENGQFGAGDVADGGSGGTNDQLGLRGNYTIVFGAGQLISIESISLVSAQDTRFGPLGSVHNYNLTMNDGNVAAGQLFTVDAAPLRGGETLTFNGAAELDGSYRVAGGAGSDTITGGTQADILIGRGGADALTGGAGNDQFRYNEAADSTALIRDTILDFTTGDVIDLSRIDANSSVEGNQAFTFIGATPFTNSAGQLRAYQSGADWFVEGDVNGDGAADLVIELTGPTPLVMGDFVL